jgi:thiamine kinase-like enzyme
MERNNNDYNFLNGDITIISNFLPGWKGKGLEDIQVDKISFGMGSYVFKVSDKNSLLEPILYRKYIKDKPQEKINTENLVFQTMSDIGVSPKLYGFTDDVRIEEFIKSRVIESNELNETDIRRRSAIKLAKFHTIKSNLILDKFNSDFITGILNHTYYVGRFNENVEKTEIYTNYELDYVKKIKQLLSAEEKEFIYSSYKNKYEMILSHNDIWVGNILLNETTRDILLIDYEMINFNFAGYDVGKLLLEPMYKRRPGGPEYDLIEEYMPSESDILDFIRFYLIARKDNSFEYSEGIEQYLEKYESNIYSSQEERENIMKEFLNEVYVGMMLSGYYSAVLGLMIGKNHSMPMDFIKFSIDGYQIYNKYKLKLFN